MAVRSRLIAPIDAPWEVVTGYSNSLSGAPDGERPLTEVRRPLTAPPALKELAQPFGHGKHPLPQSQKRKDMIDQVRGRFGHAPGVAGGAHATTLAGVRDQEIVLRLLARDSNRGQLMRNRVEKYYTSSIAATAHIGQDYVSKYISFSGTIGAWVYLVGKYDEPNCGASDLYLRRLRPNL